MGLTSREIDTRPLLILDLHETLIHAADDPLAEAADFCVYSYYVYKRPFLDQFLIETNQQFQLAIWSSSGQNYLQNVVSQIIPDDVSLEFVWGQERCVHRFDAEWYSYYFVKDLRKVKRRGYDLSRTLIADDTPRKVERNYGNAIYMKPFLGDPNDEELRRLSHYVSTLLKFDDFRSVEKRNWCEETPLDGH